MKKRTIVLLIAVIALLFTSCSNSETQTTTEKRNMYEKISPEQANSIIDEQSDYVILDVRTQEEFDEGHIENAVLIPDYDIEKQAENTLPDKEKLILVYCRSGRRSEIAAKKLIDMGYTNVKDFGGIIDWPYETVK